MSIRTQSDLIQSFVEKQKELIDLTNGIDKVRAETLLLEKMILSDESIMGKIKAGGIVTLYDDLITCAGDGSALLVSEIVRSYEMDGELNEDQIPALNER